MVLAYIISNSKEGAEEIALVLLEKQLVYSVNLLPDLPSMRWDNGKIIKFNRTIVLAKTKALLYTLIEEEVKRFQTSGSAIVLSIPITQLSQDLFDNIQANTRNI